MQRTFNVHTAVHRSGLAGYEIPNFKMNSSMHAQACSEAYVR